MPSNNDADVEMSDSVSRYGFKPGQTVHECTPEFSLDDLKDALFESTYRNPKPVPVEADNGVKLQVVVTSVQQVYTAFAERSNDQPLGCYNDPDWRIEGWLLKSGFDPYEEVVRVRMHIESLDRLLSMAYLQRVSSNDPTT